MTFGRWQEGDAEGVKKIISLGVGEALDFAGAMFKFFAGAMFKFHEIASLIIADHTLVWYI